VAEVTINPSGVGTYDTFTLISGASKTVAASDTNDATYLEPTSGVDFQTFQHEDVPVHGGSPVSSVVLHARAYGDADASLTFRSRLFGVNVDSSAQGFSAGPSHQEKTFTLTRPGGGSWTMADVAALEAGCSMNWAVTTPRLVKFWIVVTYSPISVLAEAIRKIASLRMLRFQKERGVLSIATDLSKMDLELLDILNVSHLFGPSADGLGWLWKNWQHRPFFCERQNFDPNRMLLTLEAEDAKPQLVTFLDLAFTDISSYANANGVIRVDAGNTRTFDRDSKAWIEDASGNGKVVEVGYDVEKIDRQGFLYEGAATNLIPRSSFKSGTTGWTLAGDATADSNDLLFDTAITATALRLDTNASVDASAQITTGTVLANTKCRVSIDHREFAAGQLKWILTRAVDGKYFRDSDGTWQVAAQENNLALRATRTRDISASVIDVGASDTTLTFKLLMTGGADYISFVHHVQLEDKPYATSRIVTDGAAVTRAYDSLVISNNSGLRCWPATRGTLRFQFIPYWSSTDGTIGAVFFHTYYDANNFTQLIYSADRFIFKRRVAGVDYSAEYVTAIVRGTTYELAARWTSDQGEHGLANYTLSVFVNGVKGTDATAVAQVEASPADMYIGSTGGGLFCADGFFRYGRITQQCLLDEEIARASS